MSNRQDILLLSAGLEEGETARFLCPSCAGGSSGEKSLSITHSPEGLLWQCFRARCTEKGTTISTGIPYSSIPRTEEATKVKVVPKVQTLPLGPKALEWIESEWGVVAPKFWYWTHDYGGRVAMSVRSPKYLHRGWCLRDIRGMYEAKALTFIDPGEESLSWYKEHPKKGTVLVEDIPSAVRASAHLNAVALLGTAIGASKAVEIAEHATRPIIIALDQDATSLSFKYERRWGLLWGDVRVLPLTKDLKNMTEDELMDTIQ